MRSCFGLISILLVFPATILAQGNYQLHKMAVNAMREKNWELAMNQYRKLYNRDSSNVKITYAYAEACRENMETDLALHLYRKVIQQRPSRFPLTAYWIGQLYKQQMNYKEAGKWFVRFNRTKLSKDLSPYKTSARNEVETCELAAIWMNNPRNMNLHKADSAVNSLFSEYAPLRRGNKLYYSSLKHVSRVGEGDQPKSKIYILEQKAGGRNKPRVLDTNINATYLHNANSSIDESGKRMVFSRCSNINASEYSCKLYQSVFVNNKWQNASLLGDSINLGTSSNTHPSFGKLNGREVLFFSSNRSGGKGGYDTWYITAHADGSFSQVKHAGDQVNSEGHEICPFYDSVENKLYFSSSAFPGFGSLDIFYSEFNGSEFGKPRNAGYPINSGYNDLYFNIDRESGTAWLASNRKGSNLEKKTSCCNDIFTYDIEAGETPVTIDSLLIRKEKLKLLVPLTLYFHNDEPEPKTEFTSTKKSYTETYEAYQALAADYMASFSAGYKKVEKEKAEALIESFFKDSLQAGFENLGKFSVLLEEVLKSGQKVRITLKGYCSPLASTEYNQNLAKRRISSLRNYFEQSRGGVFNSYIRATGDQLPQLQFIEEDVGELPNSRVSSDFNDKRNSIYSPFAASERKIQIIAVAFD